MLRACEWLEVGEHTPISFTFVGLIAPSDLFPPFLNLSCGSRGSKGSDKSKKRLYCELIKNM